VGDADLVVLWLLKKASDNPQLFSMMSTESEEVVEKSV
jgi:hypothetical protein